MSDDDDGLAALEREFEDATKTRDEARNRPSGRIAERDPRHAWIRYADALKKVKEGSGWKVYVDELKGNHPHDGGGCLGLFSTQVKKGLREERDFVYCITTNSSGRNHLAFSWEDETHCRIASTVYKKLLNLPPDTRVEAGGDHWKQIGFQGSNFNTDAGRLGGVFVFLQMLAFLNIAPKLADETFTESQAPSMRPFSWALWSMFASTRVIDTYDRKKLNKHINKENDVMKVLNLFYIGIFSETFTRWCEQETRDEMHDFNSLRKDITHWSLTDPAAVLKKAKLAMRQSKDTVDTAATSSETFNP